MDGNQSNNNEEERKERKQSQDNAFLGLIQDYNYPADQPATSSIYYAPVTEARPDDILPTAPQAQAEPTALTSCTRTATKSNIINSDIDCQPIETAEKTDRPARKDRRRVQDNAFLGHIQDYNYPADQPAASSIYSAPVTEAKPENTLAMTPRAQAKPTALTSCIRTATKSNRSSAGMLHQPIETAETTDRPASNTSMPDRDPLDRLESGLSDHGGVGIELPRLILRNRPFGQSNNKVNIEHNQGWKIYALLKHNWFHAFLRWPTSRSLLALMIFWTGAILIFALFYMWHDNADPSLPCGLGKADEPVGFGTAFAFSLETCTTVGYGLPNGDNHFFEVECGSLQFLIYVQMAWSMLFNAFLLAFLYARFGRSEARSTQVINSRQALVSCVDGQVRFQVRLFDADAQHPVVEAHVRMYCVMNHRPVPRPLRLLQPDDDMGGMLFLSFPTVVSHHIDLYSLLHPPTDARYRTKPTGLVLRQVDGTTAGRDDVICPVCGESYGTIKRWKNHVRYQRIVERQEEYPVAGTHLSLDLDELESQSGIAMRPSNDLEELKDFFYKNVSEVICVVEGIDPLQSGTFQSLQSYRYEDIVWDEHSQFAPCMTVVNGRHHKKTGENSFQLDLDRYHDIVLDTHQIREQKKRKEEEAKAIILAAESTVGPNEGLECATSMAAMAAAALPSPPADVSTVKRRHRRVKSLSRRPGDALFVATPEEVGRLAEKGHPLLSQSMPPQQSSYSFDAKPVSK